MSGPPVDAWPPGHDLSAFNAVWNRPKIRRESKVLEVTCAENHFLAAVYRVAGDFAYVAEVLPWDDVSAVRTIVGQTVEVRPGPLSGQNSVVRYVEFLNAMRSFNESMPAAPDVVPAQCKCRSWEIQRAWLLTHLGSTSCARVRFP